MCDSNTTGSRSIWYQVPRMIHFHSYIIPAQQYVIRYVSIWDGHLPGKGQGYSSSCRAMLGTFYAENPARYHGIWDLFLFSCWHRSHGPTLTIPAENIWILIPTQMVSVGILISPYPSEQFSWKCLFSRYFSFPWRHVPRKYCFNPSKLLRITVQ